MMMEERTLSWSRPWKREGPGVGCGAMVRAASLATHFTLGFVTGSVRIFAGGGPFGLADGPHGGPAGMIPPPRCEKRKKRLRRSRENDTIPLLKTLGGSIRYESV